MELLWKIPTTPQKINLNFLDYARFYKESAHTKILLLIRGCEHFYTFTTALHVPQTSSSCSPWNCPPPDQKIQSSLGVNYTKAKYVFC